jgi:hypothetical protein
MTLRATRGPQGDRLGPVADGVVAEQFFEVGAYRSVGDAQADRNLLVRHAISRKPKNLCLAAGQVTA